MHAPKHLPKQEFPRKRKGMRGAASPARLQRPSCSVLTCSCPELAGHSVDGSFCGKKALTGAHHYSPNVHCVAAVLQKLCPSLCTMQTTQRMCQSVVRSCVQTDYVASFGRGSASRVSTLVRMRLALHTMEGVCLDLCCQVYTLHKSRTRVGSTAQRECTASLLTRLPIGKPVLSVPLHHEQGDIYLHRRLKMPTFAIPFAFHQGFPLAIFSGETMRFWGSTAPE